MKARHYPNIKEPNLNGYFRRIKIIDLLNRMGLLRVSSFIVKLCRL